MEDGDVLINIKIIRISVVKEDMVFILIVVNFVVLVVIFKKKVFNIFKFLLFILFSRKNLKFKFYNIKLILSIIFECIINFLYDFLVNILFNIINFRLLSIIKIVVFKLSNICLL